MDRCIIGSRPAGEIGEVTRQSQIVVGDRLLCPSDQARPARRRARRWPQPTCHRAMASAGTPRRPTIRRTGARCCGSRTPARRTADVGTAWPTCRAGTDTLWMIESSVAPWFIIAITSVTRSSNAVAMSSRTWAMRCRAGDRQTVGRHEKLRSCGDHLAQGSRPFQRIALHLLRVAGVGEVPDHEVAGHDPLAVGQPRPQMIVGLAAGMVELHPGVADVSSMLHARTSRRVATWWTAGSGAHRRRRPGHHLPLLRSTGSARRGSRRTDAS